MKNLDLRVKRPRTATRDSTFEALEKFASVEGRSIANTLEGILENRLWERFQEFKWELRKPGKATS
jgi:hypothetical protein